MRYNCGAFFLLMEIFLLTGEIICARVVGARI